jgi:hypothetical protein
MLQIIDREPPAGSLDGQIALYESHAFEVARDARGVRDPSGRIHEPLS